MKAGKLAIRPWLSCRYTENTLMDEPWFSAIIPDLCTSKADLFEERCTSVSYETIKLA